MEIYGFGRARENTRGIEREIEKIDDRVPRNEGLSSIIFGGRSDATGNNEADFMSRLKSAKS